MPDMNPLTQALTEVKAAVAGDTFPGTAVVRRIEADIETLKAAKQIMEDWDYGTHNLETLIDVLEDGLPEHRIAAGGTCGRCGSNPAPHRLQGVALCQSCDETLNAVAVGDRVCDPFDGTWREIVRIDGIADGGTAHMRDGGCMSVAECVKAEKRLPGEGVS